jgi:hypothetical protein
MNQYQLDRAVARATGETVETIQTRGFSFMPCPIQRCRPPRRRQQHWRNPARKQAVAGK